MDQGRQITEAVSIPIIGDGDNGYGNAMNVKRTVKGYIKAGFAGIILEDQVNNTENISFQSIIILFLPYFILNPVYMAILIYISCVLDV